MDKIYLKDFKCYEEFEVSFKPFTILTGVNSSGKSSIIQALKLHNITKKMLSDTFIINLKEKNKWDFIGYAELMNNCSDSNYFSIKVDEREYKYEEFFQNKKPKNNYTLVKKEFEENLEDEYNIIFIHADRYFTKNQIYGDVSEYYNPTFSNQYIADYLFYNSNELKENDILSMLNKLLMKLNLVSDGITIIPEKNSYVVRIDGLDIEHVGTGIRYVIPILLSVISNKNTTICIENPELHLHPKAQSKLMEIICEESIANNNQLIIETHSDHIVNSLRVLSKERVIPNEDIKIIFSNRDEIHEISIDSTGRFDRKPTEFFDEFEIQLVKLL